MNFKRFKHVMSVGGVSWLAMTGIAVASMQEAMEALNEQDYTFAFEEFTRLADKEKNPDARYQLGAMYEHGDGVPTDEFQAYEIYRRAADEGSLQAMVKMGNAYYTGTSVEKSYPDAYQWYVKAAQKGSYPAQYNIGLMHEEGLIGKKNFIKAFEFYKKAADQGYAPAQMALGRMYLKGIGTPQDYTKAIFWYKLAADQGNTKAQMELARLYSNTTVRGLPFNVVGAHIYYNLISAYGTSPLKEEAAERRNALTMKMKNEDVLLAQSRAQQWKKKTREQSLPSMVQDDSLMGDISSGTKKSAKPAEKTPEIKITVKTGNQDLIVAAGISRRQLNTAVRANNLQAVVDALNKKSSEGNRAAKLALAGLYLLGQGIEENPQAAFNLYKELSTKNDAVAFARLAPMYCEGKGVEPDLAECYKHILLAKRYADEDSQADIAESIRMLDENLDKDICETGKKLADEWDKKEEKAAPKKAEKSKNSLKFWEKLSSDDDDAAMEKPAEEKEEEKKEEKKTTDEDDLFSDLL